MSELMSVAPTLQQVIEAIAAVIGVEVTIYDDDLVVVAATGNTDHTRVGQRIRGYVISHVMNTGEPFINEQPGVHAVCSRCFLRKNCPELADISCPIRYGTKSIGAISFTAFSDEQRIRLLTNKKVLIELVTKISRLVQGLVAQEKLLRENVVLTEQLRTILSAINEGIIAIDEHARITHLNKRACQILGISQEEKESVSEEILGRLLLKKALEHSHAYPNEEIRSSINGRKVNVMVSAWPVVEQDRTVGAVAILREMGEIRNLVYQMAHQHKSYTFDDIITCSSRMNEIKEQAKRVAVTKSTILITGESGTGKELFARAIHSASPRRNGPFVAINCAAIPEGLLESELFGYEEGAFTGANRKGKPGKFELAHGGTLFLDEIADMPLLLQAKMLRALEDQCVERIGGLTQIQVDVRIIAATNKNLEEKVKSKEFRNDLYFRLNVIPLRIPPLRERPEDIIPLIRHFLSKHEKSRQFEEAALEILRRYEWPGNVRELQNCVEYALNIGTRDKITVKDLPPRLRNSNYSRDQTSDILPLREMEIMLIRRALERYGFSYEGKRKAATALGIDVATLYRKLKALAIVQ